MQLEDAVMIVTGAGSGIGQAIATHAAAAGMHVVCCGRRVDRLNQTVEAITDAGGKAVAMQLDVTEFAQFQGLADEVVTQFGRIDVLFNNAGSFGCIGAIHEVDPRQWTHDVMVNLVGSFHGIRAVLPHMIQRDAGVIINMDGGKPPFGTSYGSSKAGVMQLTKSLDAELTQQGSKVIALSAGPGLVHTEMTEYQVVTPEGRKYLAAVGEMIKTGKVRQPDDIAAKTVEVLKILGPQHHGKYFSPETDLGAW